MFYRTILAHIGTTDQFFYIVLKFDQTNDWVFNSIICTYFLLLLLSIFSNLLALKYILLWQVHPLLDHATD